MKWIKKCFSHLWSWIIPFLGKLKDRIDNLSKRQISLITFAFSLIVCAIKFFELNIYLSAQDLVVSFFAMVASLYLILKPVFYYFRPKFIPFFEDHIIYSIYLLGYFFILVPVLSFVDYFFLSSKIDNFIINLIYTIIVIISIIFILIIIVTQFLTTIFHKRTIKEMDLLVIFITYFAAGVSYGSLYYILDKMSPTPLFQGISPSTGFNFISYINYMYTSLGALTSVGSGTIVPINPWIRLLYVQETILGFFLINFTMGYIFLIVGSKIVSENDGDKKNEKTVVDYIKHYTTKVKTDLKTIENNGKIKKNDSETEGNDDGKK